MPLSWWISVSGSLFTRSCAQAASIGRFLLSTSSGNIMPSLRLALCEIASNSLPALRCVSIQFHRSSGWSESIELNGTSGTFLESLKMMLRCMLRLSGVEVHS